MLKILVEADLTWNGEVICKAMLWILEKKALTLKILPLNLEAPMQTKLSWYIELTNAFQRRNIVKS